MEKLSCNSKFIDPLYFNNLFINDDGNIVIGAREEKQVCDRFVSNHFKITDKFSIEYYEKSSSEMVRISFGKKIYEDVLSALFVRSYFGYNFNAKCDYSGKAGLNTLWIDDVRLKNAYRIRKNKLVTKQEQRFYDLWVSVINDVNFCGILHGRYFNKWCGCEESKKFNDKFLYLYRAAIKRLKLARAGIRSEVLVAVGRHYYFLDFFVPSLNLGIEIDGYHHYYDLDQATNDFIRTSEIKEKRKIEIIRFPNKDIESMTKNDMKALVELCYDLCGYQVIKSISRLNDIKTLPLKRIARSILNGKSAAKFPDLHSKYINDAISNKVHRL